ncbi:MAG: hypothetical protein ACK5HP_00820 [Bacilli bacterium]
MNILFIVAMNTEADPIINHFNLNKVDEIFFKNENINLLITGVSRNSVVSSLLNLITNNIIYLDTTIFINVGLVGTNNLKIGEVVMISKSYGYHFDLTPFGESLYHSSFSPYELNTISNIEKYDCYTSDAFVLNTTITDNAVFDMELNAITPFVTNKLYSVKIVSDTLCADKYRNFNFEESFERLFFILDEIVKENILIQY